MMNEIEKIAWPTAAMILAAGRGTRMRPLTDNLPKPLVTVAGKPLLAHILDKLANAGIARVVINAHHLAEQIEAFAASREAPPEIILSDERDRLLDTGGGVKRALPHLGTSAFYVVNGDAFWIEEGGSAFASLANNWAPEKMDMLLLLAPSSRAVGFSGAGDFFMDDDGVLARRGDRSSAPWIYAGVILMHARILEGVDKEVFSLNRCFDAALERNHLFGLPLNGRWAHVGDLEGMDLANQMAADK